MPRSSIVGECLRREVSDDDDDYDSDDLTDEERHQAKMAEITEQTRRWESFCQETVAKFITRKHFKDNLLFEASGSNKYVAYLFNFFSASTLDKKEFKKVCLIILYN